MDRRRSESPLDVPLYTPSEAARYLGLPVATVRSWVKGRAYPTRGGRRQFLPIVIPADPDGTLSFRNLVELQVLRALRVKHGVRIDTIRRALEFMRRVLEVAHPLASARMRTDGSDLFVNYLETVVRARDGQVVLGDIVAEHLSRVEWEDEEPVRLFPFPRKGAQRDRRVVLDPRVRWGKPVLVGTAIPIEDIAERRDAGESVTSIAKDYGRPVEEIKGALRYAA